MVFGNNSKLSDFGEEAIAINEGVCIVHMHIVKWVVDRNSAVFCRDF